MKTILSVLLNYKRLEEQEECDNILIEFTNFNVASNSIEFQNFDVFKDRVDKFLSNYLEGQNSYKKLWEVIKILMILSHGQAIVERGFSFHKKNIEVENLTEETFVAKLLVLDELKKCVGVKHFQITKELRSYAKSARKKYIENLNEQKLRLQNDENIKKKKSIIQMN